MSDLCLMKFQLEELLNLWLHMRLTEHVLTLITTSHLDVLDQIPVQYVMN